MTQPTFSICVYCGSKPGSNPLFTQAAVTVGQWIAAHGGQLVYGGGSGGLMGIVADATLAAGGRVIGIIPKALVEKEWAHHGCTKLHIVENMHDRKRMMAEHADAFLALPGGIGTLEELFEVSDRMHVIARGRLSPSVPIAEASVERIGEWMSGLWDAGAQKSAKTVEVHHA